MKKSGILTLLLILIAVALLVPRLLPHIWAHDSSAKLIYDGHISQNIELFHGSAGRKLVFINEPLLYTTAFVYSPSGAGQTGAWMACPRRRFHFVKLAAFNLSEAATQESCEAAQAGTVAAGVSTVGSSATNLDFVYHGKPIHVSWLGYTEPPR